jgi:hypothetical protein
MRKLTFHEPNFECEVERFQSRTTRLEYAETEAELKERLEARDFTVLSITPYKFKTWQDLAAKHQDAFAPVKPYNFNPDVWKAIKQYLYALSNDKCGYCEAEVLVTSDGEVEHYRPKAAVDTDAGHPGYYWLAYSIENYVPTCHKCNTGKGKRNQFPIKGKRVRKPGGSVAAEKPLLLQPFVDSPDKHLKFIVNTSQASLALGCIAGMDEIGKTSVQVYQLNREHLVVDRQKAVDALRDQLALSWLDAAKRKRLIERIRTGNYPYPATCRAVLQAWFDEQQAALNEFREQAKPTD